MAYYWTLSTGVILDDAYIYFRLAENFLRLGKPVFNAGDSAFIATSVLWTFLLTAVKGLFPFLNIVLIAKGMWLLLLILASYFAHRLWARHDAVSAIFAGAPFLLSPAVGLMTGGEIALLYSALLGALWAGDRDKAFAAGIFLGIGILTRGEFIFLAAPLLVHGCCTARRRGDSRARLLSRMAIFLGTGAIIVLLAHTYLWAAFGSPLPRTLKIKMMQGASGQWPLFRQEIWNSLRRALPGARIWLLPFAALGAWKALKVFAGAAFYTLAYSLAYIGLKIPAYGWYYYPYTVLAPMLILAGIGAALDAVFHGAARILARVSGKPEGPGRARPLWTGLAFAGVVLWMYPMHLALFRPENAHRLLSVESDNERVLSYRKAAEWLRPRLAAGDVVLVQEIGILSALLPGTEIRDTNGLASPIITRETMNDWDLVVDMYRPRFIVFPIRVEAAEKTFTRQGRVHPYRPCFTANPSASRYAADIYTADPAKPET